MNKKTLEALGSFESVWKRVEQSRKGFQGSAELMPSRRPPKTKTTRFAPPGSRRDQG